MCTFEHLADMVVALPVPTQVQTQHDLNGGYISVASHKPNISYNVDNDLKQFIIKYERFVQGQLHFTKNKIIQQKLLESDLQHELWFESRLHKSQIYKKKKKESVLGCCTAEVLWCNHSHPCHMPFFKVEDGCLKGSMKLSCTLLWRRR